MNKEIEVLEDEEEYESPYCEICGHCGEIGCCGIRNFIDEHIEGKTNCKNEGFIINDLINLCDYKDEVFEENKRLNNIIGEALAIANERVNYYHHINKKEILEDWENIFDVLVERDNQELKGSDK